MEHMHVARFSGTEVTAQLRDMVDNNSPAVLEGSLGQWPAVSRWDPSKGGLEYLKNLAGETQIQAITSMAGSIFYGHIKGHERVCLKFASFIDLILSSAGTKNALPDSEAQPGHIFSGSSNNSLGFEGAQSVPLKASEIVKESKSRDLDLYLAQVPIYNRKEGSEDMLSSLMQDISTPSIVDGKEVCNINLWMSMGNSRSSTHYDPYHNVLCVVAGEKRVLLWPPSAAPYLYPLPIYGEASNHSAVDIDAPNIEAHPLYQEGLQKASAAILRPGDALFIPEGWYHQVDNTGVTIAVNFWWASELCSSMGSEMDGYILRRVVSRKGREKFSTTCSQISNSDLSVGHVDFPNGLITWESLRQPPRSREAQRTMLKYGVPDPTRGPVLHSRTIFPQEKETLEAQSHVERTEVDDIGELSPEEIEHVRILVTCAIGEASSTPCESPPTGRSDSHRSFCSEDMLSEGKCKNTRHATPFDDPICREIGAMGAGTFQRVFTVMAIQFPHSLRVLVMNILSPAAAELLTLKFEELDHHIDPAVQANFFEKFYGVFESPNAVMALLLKKKEEFSAQALRSVMSRFLGLSWFPA